ncbi:MAG TPA: molybdopterin-binding protein [Bacteroidia bacterium]|jgi:nicotinamide-nucleotide amidase|nr:molybdopterin-binding protein [Bacteroidia bacterium]
MLAEIITIGNEILIGQIVDTNSAWLGTQLNLAGISVKQITSVSDEKDHILEALAFAEKRADIIIITGGLGPTKDDITKHTLCEYFNTRFITNKEVLEYVKHLFTSRNKPLLEVNLKQADVPENCEVLPNKNGTAPGMWFKKNTKIFISMPGVPNEMKGIFSDYALPKLKDNFELPFIYHRTILTEGIGESFLAKLLEDWENALSKKGIKLAYLPAKGKVRLRLSATGKNKNELETLVNHETDLLYEIAKEYIYGEEEFGKAAPTQEPL